jgi:hypothetical protein
LYRSKHPRVFQDKNFADFIKIQQISQKMAPQHSAKRHIALRPIGVTKNKTLSTMARYAECQLFVTKVSLCLMSFC